MVKEEVKYACPYCGEEYKDDFDAEECAKECVEPQIEDVDEIEIFICEFCEKDYKDYSKAEQCEQKHKKSKDKYFRISDDNEKREKLKKAAEHPTQRKLK